MTYNYSDIPVRQAKLNPNNIATGDARTRLKSIESQSIDLAFWSPPYHVGKSYERDSTLDDWKRLMSEVIAEHGRLIRPGGFMAVNISDILCFPDPTMPRFQADNIQHKHTLIPA